MRDGDEFYLPRASIWAIACSAAARAVLGAGVRAAGAGRWHPHSGHAEEHPAAAAPFDEVRDRVLSDVIADQSGVLTAGNDRFLLKRADIALQRGYE
jgi:hypothetical protein